MIIFMLSLDIYICFYRHLCSSILKLQSLCTSYLWFNEEMFCEFHCALYIYPSPNKSGIKYAYFFMLHEEFDKGEILWQVL
ncbi:hypothetical protein POPTR_003G152701v4 [Populus trichocarpa]|uniref:Uncharacterized protein n=1 Tax=Populus trichocarpa TaxID=3694 RepID=A0ACC0T9L0_POPTR|nr:hypothetical protein BDE02_03G138700 [Populus trichocarpa]KAI9398242.1 hypothetical protein POPTR_003G152701v4 [Populus trichocarpa]